MNHRSNKIRVLCVANKKLPPGDHRILFGKRSRNFDITYALPAKPDNVDDGHYVRMGFVEGISWVDLAHFGRLFMYLHKHNAEYQLVHFYATKLYLIGPILSFFTGVQSLFTLTGLGRIFYDRHLVYRILRGPYMALFRFAAILAKRVLFQNSGDMRLFASKFPTLKHKFRLIGSTTVFPILSQKDFSTRKLTVLSVARLLESKGIDDFLEAGRRLAGDSFEFVLVGPESDERELVERVKQRHEQGVINYKGELLGDALITEFQRAHIFYFPSAGEGLSRVLIEAGYSRLCPVAYDIAGNRDLIGKGHGFLAPAGGVDQVVDLLIRLQHDRQELEREAVAYQAFIKRYFSPEAYVKKMESILADVCAECALDERKGNSSRC